jgi:hypothetical protein
VEVIDIHNHEISSVMNGHPYSRRLKEIQKNKVREFAAAGIRPTQILAAIRNESPGCLASRQTVQNELKQARKEFLAGRRPVEALIDVLKDGPYIYDVDVEPTGMISRLFFSHTQSVKLALTYGNVFVMDCTYKTNRYDMPLLNIVGIMATFNSFNAAFVFLSKECEEDYVWALRKFAGIGVSPQVVVTDRELALMNALKIVFSACGTSTRTF